MMAVIAAIAVCGLYFGRPVLMPLALAVLMSFAIAPLGFEMIWHQRADAKPSATDAR
ncbi:MAG: hypothetical protein J0I29_00910 [Rhizobiales bacterium]|nr:hypothetical protein [Hyphomicrobiales bacterium]